MYLERSAVGQQNEVRSSAKLRQRAGACGALVTGPACDRAFQVLLRGSQEGLVGLYIRRAGVPFAEVTTNVQEAAVQKHSIL